MSINIHKIPFETSMNKNDDSQFCSKDTYKGLDNLSFVYSVETCQNKSI